MPYSSSHCSQVLAMEFYTFTLLDFHLNMDVSAIAPHIQRIARALPENYRPSLF